MPSISKHKSSDAKEKSPSRSPSTKKARRGGDVDAEDAILTEPSSTLLQEESIGKKQEEPLMVQLLGSYTLLR
jgi:hypothetical protein